MQFQSFTAIYCATFCLKNISFMEISCNRINVIIFSTLLLQLKVKNKKDDSTTFLFKKYLGILKKLHTSYEHLTFVIIKLLCE